MCFNRKLRLKHFPFPKITVLPTDWSLYCLPVCSVRINLTFTKIITQTQTNACTTLTIVVKMPPVPSPKDPSTVVADQGTLEMATTVQVRSVLELLSRFPLVFRLLVQSKKG